MVKHKITMEYAIQNAGDVVYNHSQQIHQGTSCGGVPQVGTAINFKIWNKNTENELQQTINYMEKIKKYIDEPDVKYDNFICQHCDYLIGCEDNVITGCLEIIPTLKRLLNSFNADPINNNTINTNTINTNTINNNNNSNNQKNINNNHKLNENVNPVPFFELPYFELPQFPLNELASAIPIATSTNNNNNKVCICIRD